MTAAPLTRKEALPAQPTATQASGCDLVGTWQMMSWTIEDLASGERSDALGPDPLGYISYSPGGRVLVFILKRDRPRPAALVPTDAEKIALYDSMFAYGGTYTRDATKVVHHIDMSWNEAWSGTHQIRFCKLEGDLLTYTGAPAKSPLNGRDCVHHVVFRRSR